MKLADIEPSVLEAIACLDGAVVVDLNGRLITFGASAHRPRNPGTGPGRPGRAYLGRPGRLAAWARAQGQRGRLHDHVLEGPAGLGALTRLTYFKCFSRNAKVPLPLIVCGPTKNSIAHRSPIPSLASYRKLTLANS